MATYIWMMKSKILQKCLERKYINHLGEFSNTSKVMSCAERVKTLENDIGQVS